MQRTQYREYIIEPSPELCLDDKTWSLNITIERHDGRGVTVKNYSASNSFETKEEAIEQCVIFGKRIIDHEVEGCEAP